jgi:hypothetical protein
MEPIRISPIDRLRHVEPPITDERGQPPTTDAAFDHRELLIQLAELLGRAARGRSARRSEPWAEGELFSFDRRVQAEWVAVRGSQPSTRPDALSEAADFLLPPPSEGEGRGWGELADGLQALSPPPQPSPTRGEGERQPPEAAHLRAARQRTSDTAAAWEAIGSFASKAIDVLTGSLAARRIARAVPGLCDNAAALAEQIPLVRDLVDLLAVEDDAIFLVLHPPTERGFRVQVAGIESNFQLQVLLADLLAGDDSAGRLPAERPDPRVVAVYRGEGRQQEALVGRASFGMYSAGALRADLTLPDGLAGCDQWLWGAMSPASIPYFDGERVILLGPPPFRMTCEVKRRFPRLRGDAQVVEVLDGEGVRSWLVRLVRPETPKVASRSTF